MLLTPCLQVCCNGTWMSAEESADRLRLEMIPESGDGTSVEFHGSVTNVSDQTLVLNRVRLAEIRDLRELGLGGEPYLVYRSGRHKNEMKGFPMSPP